MRQRNTPDTFWRRILKSENCWIWIGALRSGYGELSFVSITGSYNPIGAHVVAWILTNGPIPEGMDVLHKCDNPPCCRPDHLFLGTSQDNMRDMAEKGRSAWSERSSLAKLSKDRVLNIIGMSSQGVPQNRIAKIFELHESTVSLIVRGKRWEHLAGVVDNNLRQSF